MCFGIPSTGCVKYLYIEKELIPAEWKVFLILVITSVSDLYPVSIRHSSELLTNLLEKEGETDT